MELTEEQLKEVEQFAQWLMTPQEIAAILEIEEACFLKMLKKKTGPIYKAYIKGKLFTEAALRKTTITFAKQGSTPALTAALKLRDEQNLAILKR